MSNELLSAVGELTEAVESKVATMVRDTRNAAAEIQTIKSLIAGRAATESKGEREYRKAWLTWLATKDSRALARVRDEHKDVATTSLPGGGYGMPTVTADAVGFVARTVNPWLDPAVLGIEIVAGRDFREPVNLSDGEANVVAEGSSRSGTTEGTFIEVRPSWGEFYAFMQASEWARSDIANFEAFIVREAGRQLGAKLAASIWNGSGSGAVAGLINTTPSVVTDSGAGVSPEALRDQAALQYISTTGSPVTSITLGDIEALLAAFREEYLLDPSFCFVMRNSTWRALVGASSVAGAAFTMPRQPTLMGFPVKFSSALPAVAAEAFPIACGAWRAGYKLVATAGMGVVMDQMTSPGFVKYHVSQRVGGTVRDCNAIKLLRCG